MTRSDFLGLYERFWDLPGGALKPEDRVEDLGGWDSLAVLNTIAVMDGEFGLQVTGEQVKRCRTLGDLLDLAGDRLPV